MCLLQHKIGPGSKHTCTKAIFTLFYNKGVDKVFNVSFISSLKVVTNIHTLYTMNVLF